MTVPFEIARYIEEEKSPKSVGYKAPIAPIPMGPLYVECEDKVDCTSATSVSAIEANKEAATTLDDSAKKPDWLAELSRKQVRK